MLTAETNERLARVGPGTPGGELLRRYWLPLRPYAQLLSEPVMKVRLLGEDLVLFRTLNEDIGLIGDRCAHRSMGMAWGIPDEDGLRCSYHGWLYGTDGRCLDTPLEARDSAFTGRIKLKGYPVREMGGLIWAYLGPEPAPLLPPWPVFVWPNAIRQIACTLLPCNWLQSWENTGDPAHNPWLHGELFKYALEKDGLLEDRVTDEGTHRAFTSIRSGIGIEGLYARPTPFGMEKGISYSTALGADFDGEAGHSTVIFPVMTGGEIGNTMYNRTQVRVPIDDTSTYYIHYEIAAAPRGVDTPRQDIVPFYEVPLWDRQGKAILDHTFTQDMIAWWSQGAITDRTAENLGRTDIPIVFLRRQLEENMRIVEDGGDPLNVFRDPEHMEEIVSQVRYRDEEEAVRRIGSRIGGYREQYHRGYWRDDVGRYAPANELVQELHRRVEEAYGAVR